MLKKITILFVAFAAMAMSVSAAEKEEGFVPIFDGKTLDGWDIPAAEKKWWKVEDGKIVDEMLEPTAEKVLDRMKRMGH